MHKNKNLSVIGLRLMLFAFLLQGAADTVVLYDGCLSFASDLIEIPNSNNGEPGSGADDFETEKEKKPYFADPFSSFQSDLYIFNIGNLDGSHLYTNHFSEVFSPPPECCRA